MELWTTQLAWKDPLSDPSGRRQQKPRKQGKSMIIDKGLGMHAFEDLMLTAGDYIDMIKLGFGTAALYPMNILQQKIRMAKQYQVEIMPGGTFLEVAVCQQQAEEFLYIVAELGFSSIEVSDGTIELSPGLRSELIRKSKHYGLNVYTEYGKKLTGSKIEVDDLLKTLTEDLSNGAELMIIEARESGVGVGIYNEEGKCQMELIQQISEEIHNPSVIMWETPQKEQQAFLINQLGGEVNLGNIAPSDCLALEALRRGLRADTFGLGASSK